MHILGIIPARFGSSRLPGKPLRDICGKPMIQHVYERAARARTVDRLIVATDDQRIVDVVTSFGGEAYLTSKDHKTGSDRIAEVAKNIDCDFVVNIQGDEPLISPEIIDEFVEEQLRNPDIDMITGCYQILDERLYENPNVVKVVTDKDGYALMFSRSLIPYPRNREQFAVYEHIGIYVYSKAFLLLYKDLPETPLSYTESLEQLKAMENGYRIKVVTTKHPYNALSVDTIEDLHEVERIMRTLPGYSQLG